MQPEYKIQKFDRVEGKAFPMVFASVVDTVQCMALMKTCLV